MDNYKIVKVLEYSPGQSSYSISWPGMANNEMNFPHHPERLRVLCDDGEIRNWNSSDREWKVEK